MATLIVALLIAASVSLQALGQDVDIRSLADKLSSGGGGSEGSQSRNIYQQTRHQPQHRIMHFGKRPLLEQPARNIDLYQQQLASNEMPSSAAGRINNNKYPLLLSIELGQGQTLQELPEDGTAYEFTQPAKNLVYNVEQRSPSANGVKLMRLMSSSEQVESGASGSKSDSELAEAKQDGQQQSQQEASAFSVSTRSMMQRPGTINKAYISSLLFGKGSLSSALPGLSYIKKAEPKENLFMHFGRK